MRIFLACPAPPRSLRGNRVTAVRWATLLRRLGHRVTVAARHQGEPCDLMVALHARKSHAAMAAYRRAHPCGPLIVCLTGTDVYGDLPHSRKAQQALAWADRIVVLQARALDELRPDWRRKAVVVHQSVSSSKQQAPKSQRIFLICVLGHLRAEKDPLQTGLALEHLPKTSRIQVVHAGRAMTPTWAARANNLMRRQPRYRWLGEVSRARARRLLARSRAFVVSSRLEGGANVVSEAIVLGVPVLASSIPGNVGLLGGDYPGYFPVGDTRALAALLHRAETDADFHRSLVHHVQRLKPLFRPEVELRAWRDLLNSLG